MNDQDKEEVRAIVRAEITREQLYDYYDPAASKDHGEAKACARFVCDGYRKLPSGKREPKHTRSGRDCGIVDTSATECDCTCGLAWSQHSAEARGTPPPVPQPNGPVAATPSYLTNHAALPELPPPVVPIVMDRTGHRCVSTTDYFAAHSVAEQYLAEIQRLRAERRELADEADKLHQRLKPILKAYEEGQL